MWGICPVAPAEPIATNIGMGCPVAELISRAKFQIDRFRGFRAPEGLKSRSPIDLRHHPCNSYALLCYNVMGHILSTTIIIGIGNTLNSIKYLSPD